MRVLSLCLVLLISSGAVVFGSDKDPDLSDAMKQSAGSDKTPVGDTHSDSHKSHGEDYSDSDDDNSFVGALIGGILQAFHGVHYDEQEYFWQIPLDAGYLVPLNGDIQGITRLSITPFSVEGESASFGLYFNGGFVNFKDGSLPDAATSSASVFGVGAAFRYYFQKAEKKWSPYLAANFGFEQLSWTYRDPVVTSSGKTIDNDSLGGFDSYAGVGVAFQRSHWFSLFGEVGFGGIVFTGKTIEGFSNDVFGDFAYFSVKAGMSFKF